MQIWDPFFSSMVVFFHIFLDGGIFFIFVLDGGLHAFFDGDILPL